MVCVCVHAYACLADTLCTCAMLIAVKSTATRAKRTICPHLIMKSVLRHRPAASTYRASNLDLGVCHAGARTLAGVTTTTTTATCKGGNGFTCPTDTSGFIKYKGVTGDKHEFEVVNPLKQGDSISYYKWSPGPCDPSALSKPTPCVMRNLNLGASRRRALKLAVSFCTDASICEAAFG